MWYGLASQPARWVPNSHRRPAPILLGSAWRLFLQVCPVSFFLSANLVPGHVANDYPFWGNLCPLSVVPGEALPGRGEGGIGQRPLSLLLKWKYPNLSTTFHNLRNYTMQRTIRGAIWHPAARKPGFSTVQHRGQRGQLRPLHGQIPASKDFLCEMRLGSKAAKARLLHGKERNVGARKSTKPTPRERPPSSSRWQRATV